ncbi:AAA family ATPase [Pseudanabaena sp. SR411]|uniref:AAA family ATPase n=1 Tax=Pseudanabaena sp. SR411 TaxID=1980935 RepID=UPI000B983B62|nr:MoxR family ATPase [Pseudanabaena sp. SR411]OYQ63923.1 AAA family ATPase [Pseudanabaena sp. SR411]
MGDWKIFKGNATPHGDIDRLPPPPNWRKFARIDEKSFVELTEAVQSSANAEKTKERGKTFKVPPNDTDLASIVNAALYLRRPLLITGKPGTGKTSLAYAVAYELQLGPVLLWPISTRSTLQEGLYRYDAIARLQEVKDHSQEELAKDIGRYIQLGAVGSALLPYKRPRVLLIDEVDKSDINLPNDLLNLFEEGEFEIPELARLAKQAEKVTVRSYDGMDVTIQEGRVQCHAFPFIILTSNGERDFPPAFLRRCLRLNMKDPDKEALTDIVRSHLGDEVIAQAEPLIAEFLKKRENGDLAPDQLLNAVYLLTRDPSSAVGDREKLTDVLLKYLSSAEDR